jgi:hypothetical protein
MGNFTLSPCLNAFLIGRLGEARGQTRLASEPLSFKCWLTGSGTVLVPRYQGCLEGQCICDLHIMYFRQIVITVGAVDNNQIKRVRPTSGTARYHQVNNNYSAPLWQSSLTVWMKHTWSVWYVCSFLEPWKQSLQCARIRGHHNSHFAMQPLEPPNGCIASTLAGHRLVDIHRTPR